MDFKFLGILLRKKKLIRNYLENKVILITNAYHPIARSLINYFDKEFEDKIKLIIIGKHPYYLAQIKKQLCEKNEGRKDLQKKFREFCIDIRNYQHVKKVFKILKQEWGQLDIIMHFDEYYTDKSIKDLTINNFYNSFKWNQLSLFNLIKAFENIFINQKFRLKILTTQIHNPTTLYYHHKRSMIQYFYYHHYKITSLLLEEEFIQFTHKKKYLKENKNSYLVKFNNTPFIENLLYQFLSHKNAIKM